jgi:predicted acyltransferase
MTTAQVAIPPSSIAGGRTPSKRLLSVDVLRGLCVAGMILVTNAGDWNYVYWPLKHADWNGVTPTDMIFPTFLFLVGVSMTASFASRLRRGETSGQSAAHILQRSVSLILLGLFLNCFDLFSLPDLRIPGILQRIGLCYLCAGLLYLSVSGKQSAHRVATLVAAIMLLLVSYWALQTLVPVPGYGVGRLGQVGTFSAFLDRAIFTTRHLWHWGGPGQMWDPEGLLTTLPAIANLLLGILAGEWLGKAGPGTGLGAGPNFNASNRKLLGMAAVGAVLMLAALALNPLIPINKKIWTPSFMLFSGGFSLLALALLYWLIDRPAQDALPRWRWVMAPALVFGTNAILGFSLANVLTPLLGLIQFHRATGQAIGVQGLIVEWFRPFLNPWNASLAYAALFVVLNIALLWPLYSRRIFLRL